jgi:MerR family transcriptional regulator, light-induced transcriptional regulator
MSANSKESGEDLVKYPIRTVTELTGVHSVTLRAWERRYGLIKPERTPKGHRLYSQADIELIHRITQLLNQGIAISQVRPLLERGMSLAEEEPRPAERDVWQDYRDDMLGAIERFNENEVEHLYNDALSLYPLGLVHSQLIIPLLRQLGERWKEREAGICEEHFFTTYLRNKLGSRIQQLNQHNNGPMLLIACLPGEYHEVGMLMFTLAVLDKGYRVLVLGANVPLQQIPLVLGQRPCAGIILSASSRISGNLLHEEIPALVSKVEIPVFVGGTASERHRQAIQDAGTLFASSDNGYALAQIAERIPLRITTSL